MTHCWLEIGILCFVPVSLVLHFTLFTESLLWSTLLSGGKVSDLLITNLGLSTQLDTLAHLDTLCLVLNTSMLFIFYMCNCK